MKVKENGVLHTFIHLRNLVCQEQLVIYHNHVLMIYLHEKKSLCYLSLMVRFTHFDRGDPVDYHLILNPIQIQPKMKHPNDVL